MAEENKNNNPGNEMKDLESGQALPNKTEIDKQDIVKEVNGAESIKEAKIDLTNNDVKASSIRMDGKKDEVKKSSNLEHEEKPLKIIYAGTQKPVDSSVKQTSVPSNEVSSDKTMEIGDQKEVVKSTNSADLASQAQSSSVDAGKVSNATTEASATGAATKTFNTPQGGQNLMSAAQAKKEVKQNKKFIIGCLAAAVVLFVIFLIVVIAFVSGPVGAQNPLAQLLGMNQNEFISGLITIVNLIFILIALSAVVATLVGFLKASMAKKDDKVTKKRGMVTALVGVVTFIFALLIWFGIYSYLDGRRGMFAETEVLPSISTEPKETTNLTAPVTIRFDASNVAVDKNNFEIVSYRWDFGNGDTQTGEKVSYTFEDKGPNDGRYDVTLNITKKHIKTGVEETETFAKLVTIANVGVSAVVKADPEEGAVPLTVKFDASESKDIDGQISRYDWDLDGDGSFDDAEGEKIEHTFDKIGKYEVGLRVTDNNDGFADTTVVITVNDAKKPEAVITSNNNDGIFLTNVSYVFDAKNSKSPNGEIVKYLWNFGDGSKEESTRTVSHTFKSPGKYEVELSIEDSEGEESKTMEFINVQNEAGDLAAIISTTPELSQGSLVLEGEVPFKVDFTADKTSTSPNIVEYQWDLNGDNKVDNFNKSTSFTYTTPGTYQVNLTVVGTDNSKFDTFIKVEAKEQAINAKLSASTVEGIVPLVVDFDASGSSYPSSSITSFEWDFGDGSNPKKGASKISYKFTKIGTFVVNLTAIGADGATDTAQININVLPVPLQACFEPSVTSGDAPLTVQFNSGCTTGTAVKYTWNFGDGGSASNNNPIHAFQDPGTYKVTLEVSDNDNVVSSATQTITVK